MVKMIMAHIMGESLLVVEVGAEQRGLNDYRGPRILSILEVR
jgi:hypothetical protein